MFNFFINFHTSVFLITKQLYILDSCGSDGHWNDNEIEGPIATRGRIKGQNWPVDRMSRTGWIQSNFCDCVNLIFSFLQKLSDYSVGILNVYLRKMFIMWYFTKIVTNFCEEYENMPHRTNIAEQCQVTRHYLMWHLVSHSNYSRYCYTVHWLIEK